MNFVRPPFTRVALAVASVFAVALASGCETRDPRKAGATLGAEHVARIEADALSFDDWAQDLKEAKRKFGGSDEEAWDQFREGYTEAVRPERAKIVAYAARQAGEDLGEMFHSFVEGLDRGTSDDGLGSPDTARALGRHVGSLIKKTEKQVESFSEGVLEGARDERNR
ncbi:MAG: hypothetical protein IPK13_05975 [Deltaproteobacteria bacterium]|nr:hypothetical protein [Deltaproteobacteria bacterium]